MNIRKYPTPSFAGMSEAKVDFKPACAAIADTRNAMEWARLAKDALAEAASATGASVEFRQRALQLGTDMTRLQEELSLQRNLSPDHAARCCIAGDFLVNDVLVERGRAPGLAKGKKLDDFYTFLALLATFAAPQEGRAGGGFPWTQVLLVGALVGTGYYLYRRSRTDMPGGHLPALQPAT